jgi:hypothetical protein
MAAKQPVKSQMVFTILRREDIASRELFSSMKVSKKKLIMIQWMFFLNTMLFQDSFCGQKQSSYPKNIELLSSLIDRVARTAVECLKLNAGDTVWVTRSAENKVEQFVHDRFYRIFSESGVCLFYSTDSAMNGFDLSLHVWEAGVKYEKYLGRSLFRQGRVFRSAELSVSLKSIRSRTGQLVWVGDLRDRIEDEVPVSHLSDVEVGSTMIGRTILPSEEKLRRWLEPAIVLVVMGAVTCLFYLIRSS